MKALLQRVNEASVNVEGRCVGQIAKGLLVFLGVERNDDVQDCAKMLDKVLAYRVFADAKGKMNLSLQDIGGQLLVVSQFTLVAETRKGLRPSFSSAGDPQQSRVLYDLFIRQAQERAVYVQSGQFGADMQVSLINDGPVTFLLTI